VSSSGAGPAVSVLIAAWNAEGSIRRALDSVLAEHDLDLECVVVDDGSTDGTARIVAEVAMADPRVVLVALPRNGGVSAARNRGLEAVRGEWLTLLDADDRFLPGGLGRLHAASRDGALAVVGQQVWSNGRRTWIGPLYDVPDIRRPGRKSLAAAPGLLYYASPHGKLFHRSVVDGLRFEGRVLGDQPWVIAGLLRAGDRLEVIGDDVYEWIRTPPRGAGPSITAATRASARRGVEAAGVAEGALARVRAEAERSLPDPRDRDRVAAAYVERLLRSDLGAHLGQALGRGDPAMGELFGAIEAFIRGVPPTLLTGSTGLARDIVAPPLRRWNRVPVEARPAFWSLARSAIAAQPDLARQARNPVERWALRAVLTAPDGVRRATAIAALRLSRIATAPTELPRAAAALRRRLGRRSPG
jgi:Glycosyl transferase family 2